MMEREHITFQNKVMGYIDYENKSYNSRRTKEHVFLKFRGFGVSVQILDYLQSKGIEDINIECEGFILKTTVLQFLSNGIDWEDSTFGKKESQLILPIEFWNKKETKIVQQVL